MRMQRNKEAPAASARSWSSKSLAGKKQHSFFYLLVRLGGLWLAKPFLFFVVLFYCLWPPTATRAHPYLNRRFGTVSPLIRFIQIFRLYWSFAVILLERSSAGIQGKVSMRSSRECNEQINLLLREGKGLIVLSAHTGFWQLALAGLCLHARVNLVHPRDPGDNDRHFFEHTECKDTYPISILDPGEGFGGFVAMAAALEKGEIVCLMGDRVAEEEKLTLPVDFMGRKAIFPGSPYRLASITGAPVAVVLTTRTGPCEFESHCLDVLRVPPRRDCPEQCLLHFASRFARVLERYAREHPYQFFNFHNLWKSGT